MGRDFRGGNGMTGMDRMNDFINYSMRYATGG